MRALTHSVLAVLLAVGFLPLGVQAQESNGANIAYTWAGQAGVVGSYTPDPAYTFNPEGGVTIRRTGVGVYEVRFANLASLFNDRTTSSEGEAGGAGHVQVTAYNTPGAYCKTNGWGVNGTALVVTVNCFDAGGDPLNARFTALFVEPGINAGELGFVWANDATSSSYTPEGTRAYNSAGGDVRIDRTGAGIYTVWFTDMAEYVSATTPLGGVHVTSYGFDNTKCQATGWNTTGDDVRVTVLCREPGGRLEDGRFTLMTNWPGTEVGPYAYAWAEQLSASSTYTPTSAYNEGRSVTVSPLGTGHYRVRFAGLAAAVSGGTVQVSARANQPTCQAEGWAPDGSALRVDVRCTNEAGAPANAQFVVSAFEGAVPSPEPGRGLADFSRFPGGTLLQEQYNDQGLRFFRGAVVIECASDEAVCSRSRSARKVITPPELASEFKRDRMFIDFNALQTEVTVSLNSASLDGRDRQVRIEAIAPDRSVADEAVGIVRGEPGWTTRLTVRADGIDYIRIWSVDIETGVEGNQFILDDLTYTDTTPFERDVTPPTVRLRSARGSGSIGDGQVFRESPIVFRVSASDEQGLAEVTSQIVYVANGTFLQPRTTLCGTVATGECGSGIVRTVNVGVTAPGDYEITATATDFAGLETVETVRVIYEPTPEPTAFVHKVEFNQSVTPFLYDRTVRLDDDVFLIPGKDLLMRYYLHSEDAPRDGYTAAMEVEIQKTDGSFLRRTLSPNAGMESVDLIPLPEDIGNARRDTLVTMRADLKRTLNYVIPGEWLNDAAFAEIVLYDGGRELSRAQIQDIDANHTTLALQVVWLNERLRGNADRLNFRDNVRPFLENASPYSDIEIVSERGFDFEGDDPLGLCYRLKYGLSLYDDDFGFGLPTDTRVFWTKALLADDLLGDCGGLATRPGRNMISRLVGANFLHEVGHNAGLQHASNAHGESGGSTFGGFEVWPYYHGAIGEPGTTFGIMMDRVERPSPTDGGDWDLFLIDPCPTADLSQRFTSMGGCALMDEDTTHVTVPHELMSYGFNAGLDAGTLPGTRGLWPSYLTYKRLFDRTEFRAASVASEPRLAMTGNGMAAITSTVRDRSQVLIATAIVLADGTAQVLPLTGRTASLDELARQVPGDVLVELLGADGVLASTTTASSVLEDGDDGAALFIQALLPDVEGVTGVRFSEQGVVVAELAASAHAPEVNVLSPTRGAQYEAGTVPIEWEGRDADENELTYIVEYSPDDGGTWETLRVVFPGSPTMFEASVEGLVTGTRGLIRVTASDGINISRGLSQRFFAVGPEPPVRFNIAPDANAGSDQTVIAGQEVALDGTRSSDPDGDPITYSWTLDGPGDPALSTPDASSSIFCAAEVGEYTATLVVNDGTVDSEPDALTVSALSIRDGLTVLIGDINSLVAEGSLSRRQGGKLTTRLARAQRLLGRGRSASAMLQSFLREIRKMERTGDLASSQANELRDSLDAIMGALTSPCTVVEGGSQALPQVELAAEVVLGLAPPRPNPTSGRTVIPFGLEEEGAVRLAVYDALGREVAVLVHGTVRGGNHAATFEAREMPAGVYVVRLVVDGVSMSAQRLTVVR